MRETQGLGEEAPQALLSGGHVSSHMGVTGHVEEAG